MGGLDSLILQSVQCAKCGAAYGKCYCWSRCSCGWLYEPGKPCGNPETKRCSSKLSVRCEVCGKIGSLRFIRKYADGQNARNTIYAHKRCLAMWPNWIVGRNRHTGEWSEGGTADEYPVEHWEVFQVRALNLDAARKMAQAERRRQRQKARRAAKRQARGQSDGSAY